MMEDPTSKSACDPSGHNSSSNCSSKPMPGPPVPEIGGLNWLREIDWFFWTTTVALSPTGIDGFASPHYNIAVPSLVEEQ